MGRDKVVVSVSTDIDFTQENREEKLVTPVDEANMAGIAISAQRINETYTGNGNRRWSACSFNRSRFIRF